MKFSHKDRETINKNSLSFSLSVFLYYNNLNSSRAWTAESCRIWRAGEISSPKAIRKTLWVPGGNLSPDSMMSRYKPQLWLVIPFRYWDRERHITPLCLESLLSFNNTPQSSETKRKITLRDVVRFRLLSRNSDSGYACLLVWSTVA
jgi:hypothetical protein